jgi:tetratricopeptide (TPR) repeat protein
LQPAITPARVAAVPEVSPPRAPARVKREDPGVEAGNDEERDPVGARLNIQRGRSALAEGRIVPARAAFERALSADPRSVAALDGLTATVFEMSNYDEVVYFANRAIKAGTRSAETYHCLGMVSFKLGRVSDALHAYLKAKALDPSIPGIDEEISRSRAMLGQR